MSLIIYQKLKCVTCGKSFRFNPKMICAMCKQLDIDHCLQCHNSINNCNYKKYMQKKYSAIDANIYFGALIAISLVTFYALGVKIL